MTGSTGSQVHGFVERVFTANEAETMAEGRKVAARLAPGTTVLLDGELGAGKTAFVRGLAEGLGLDAKPGQEIGYISEVNLQIG